MAKPPAMLPKVMILPPPQCPSWFREESDDLLYLGWGQRMFHEHRIPITRHPGWAYLVVLAGRPQLTLMDRLIDAPTGTLFLKGPDCASTWTDAPNQTSKILSWIWCEGPTPATPKTLLRMGRADRDVLTRLDQLHHDSRREVAISDRHSGVALKSIRQTLDVEFMRVLHRDPKLAVAERQVTWAVRWMQQHLENRQPVKALCEYLDIAAADLTVLFVKQVKQTPFTYFQNLRMERARSLLLDGQQAKTVARALGYKHPNDLSRAFQRHFGHSIRTELADAIIEAADGQSAEKGRVMQR